ncbi:unnamed protein product [Cylindrotheca closterium]|uniref:Uncharacterized protein n=1 Tax=Cylindrotheca closterium TaxID=2856 RepID=A0AAD2FP87_9STRA|nr:unnamed protein product [Cylindrotheca closterium]
MNDDRLRSLSDTSDEDESENQTENENKRRRCVFIYVGRNSEKLKQGNDTVTQHMVIDSCVSVIGKSAFQDCQRLVEVIAMDGLTSICESAFESCTALKKILVPDTVVEVGNRAFALCSALRDVEFPKFGSLSCIGEEAFLQCSSLQFFPVPSSVAFIKARAFQQCTELAKVLFEEELDGMNKSLLICIGDGAFEECESLGEVCLSANVMLLGKRAFTGCRSLQDADLSKTKLTVIEEMTFSHCRWLQTAKMPPTLGKILSDGFASCRHLSELVLNEGLKVIGQHAFCDCDSLIKFPTPSTLEVIGQDAFSGCGELKDIPVSQNLKSLGGSAFYQCHKLSTKMSIPAAASIEGGTFFNCYSLVELQLAIGLQRIEDDALRNCTGLMGVSLPMTVKKIGSSSFSGCISLLVVEMSKHCSEWMEWGDHAFFGCDSLMNISIRSSEGSGTKNPLYANNKNEGDFFDGCEEKDQLFDNVAESLLNRYSNLPVHEACYHDSETMGDELTQKILDLQASGEKEELVDRFGLTPFHVFATSANLREDLLTVLLDHYPIELLFQKDKQNNTMMDYLLIDQRCTKSIPLIKMILNRIKAYLSSVGLEKKWEMKRCHKILSEDGWADSYFDRLAAMQELREVVEYVTRIEVTSILELALWKRMSQCHSVKSVGRVKCGANVVIPNVMAYGSTEGPVERDPFREPDW